MKFDKSYLGEFTFDNLAVECFDESVINSVTGIEIKKLAVKTTNNKKIRMGYFHREGLKAIDSKYRKNNPLGEFLGIKKDDLTEIKSFFEKYGFLYPISDSLFVKYNYSDFFILQERLLAFIKLINNQSDINCDVIELLDATLFLLFNNPKLENEHLKNYLRENSYVYNIINAVVQLNQDNKHFKFIDEDGQYVGYYTKYSNILDMEFSFSVEDMEAIERDNFTPSWCKNVLKLFYCVDNLDFDLFSKQIVEFLFGLIYLIDPFPIETISLDSSFSEETYQVFIDNDNFMKLLFAISKQLIISEFELALTFVKPTYDVVNMKPDWKLPSLISALYFSIYYRNSKNVMYRKCENINCNQYFEVSNTNSTKKHCSSGCCENKNARNTRARKKQGR